MSAPRSTPCPRTQRCFGSMAGYDSGRWACFLYYSEVSNDLEGKYENQRKHQKDAITTDQKIRTDDEHIHEQDKQHFKESEKGKKPHSRTAKEGSRQGMRASREKERPSEW